jgi:hypothetical protein
VRSEARKAAVKFAAGNVALPRREVFAAAAAQVVRQTYCSALQQVFFF